MRKYIKDIFQGQINYLLENLSKAFYLRSTFDPLMVRIKVGFTEILPVVRDTSVTVFSAAYPVELLYLDDEVSIFDLYCDSSTNDCVNIFFV